MAEILWQAANEHPPPPPPRLFCFWFVTFGGRFQACDGMHTKYPAALNLQARVMYLSGDADAAVALQLKALAYYEQLEGLDSSSVSSGVIVVCCCRR